MKIDLNAMQHTYIEKQKAYTYYSLKKQLALDISTLRSLQLDPENVDFLMQSTYEHLEKLQMKMKMVQWSKQRSTLRNIVDKLSNRVALQDKELLQYIQNQWEILYGKCKAPQSIKKLQKAVKITFPKDKSLFKSKHLHCMQAMQQLLTQTNISWIESDFTIK